MALTETQIRDFADKFAEKYAVSLASMPSNFGVVTEQDEIARVWRSEISDRIDYSVAILRLVGSAGNLPVDYLPGSLSQNYVVTDPMVNGETHEGTYRNVSVRVYRQFEDGREYFFTVQILRKGWITSLDDGEGGIDFSEFRIQTGVYGSGSFETHLLRLRGVAKSAVRDICVALRANASYDDIACFNGTFSGTRIASRVSSQMEEDGSYLIDMSIASSVYGSTSFASNAFYKQYTLSYRSVNEIDAQEWMDPGNQSYFTPDGSPGSYDVPTGYTIDVQNSPPDDDGLVNASVVVREAKTNRFQYVLIPGSGGGSPPTLRERVGYNIDSLNDFVLGTGDFAATPAIDPYLYDVGYSMSINEFGLLNIGSTEQT